MFLKDAMEIIAVYSDRGAETVQLPINCSLDRAFKTPVAL